MIEFLRNRLRQGVRSLPVPPEDPGLPERFRGRPQFEAERCPDRCASCRPSMPSALLNEGRKAIRIDVGACLFSPEEAEACPHGAVSYTRDYRMATSSREGLISPSGEIELAGELDERLRRLFGRSLRLRSVVAGSCNGCEAELVALSNVVFDMARFGIQFVASPRHADGIVITGAVNTNMRSALQVAYEATPDPKLVIAVGACAISGGPFRGSAEILGGVPPEYRVDLWIPGCPPHPLTVLDGLLRLTGRLEEQRGLRPSSAGRI